DTSFHNIFEHASFQLDTDWRLGFTGRNGRGKTTFLKLLMGEYEYRGTISSNVIFEYFPYPIKRSERYAYEIIEEIYPDYEHWQL
ncbi:ATP-binding cassette domain-containing protein, partial [Escherichia coli]|uniref:ATP-binding cassette domain-containing protein n=1 Tax=Escherichia coli TaxID=562 RepID=UPI0028DFFFCA